MSDAPTVLIAAGGTGGHIFPGIAVADAVVRRSPRSRVLFLGTSRGLEKDLVPGRGYELRMVPMLPFSRKPGLGPLISIWSLVRSTWVARQILRREGVDVVVAMGGYVGLPAAVAARITRIPAILHESGAVPGLANRVAARLTPHSAVSFEDAAPLLPGDPRVVGMPLDAAVAGLDRHALRPEARTRFGFDLESSVVLVLGGSQGALRLNAIALDLASRWRGRDDVRVLLKTGRTHIGDVEGRLAEDGGEVVRAVGFIERMELAYAASDVAVCRAGAGTVAELAASGLPAILIPYPHATGDHQTKNARALEMAGAAVIVPDSEATPERVAILLEDLLGDPEGLRRRAAAARRLSRPGAADELASWALELGGAGPSL